MPTRLLCALVFCSVFSLTLTCAYAQTKNWVGPKNDFWNTAANWSPTGVPGLSDDVVINSTGGDYVFLNSGTASINSLALGGSGMPSSSVLVSNSAATNLTIGGVDFLGLKIGQSGDLELQAGTVTVNGPPAYDSAFDNFGRLYVAPGAKLVTYGGVVGTVYAGATYDIRGVADPGLFYNLDTIQAGVGGVQDGKLWLLNGGQNWTICPSCNLTTFTNAGQLLVGNGTHLIVNGNMVNNGVVSTGFPGGNDYFAVYGGLTNNGYFAVGSNDTAEVFFLDNRSLVRVETGGTLNLSIGDQPGIKDIPANSQFGIFGTFNQTYYSANPSAFYNLTTIEGQLELGNGQVTDIDPTGKVLALTSGYISVAYGSTLNVHGTLNNDALSYFYLNDLGTVANLDKLNNNGFVDILPGTQLFLLQQPNGITTVPAGSTFLLDGACYAGATTSAPNCFHMLDTVDGTLELSTTQVINDAPAGGVLNISGLIEVASGTTFNHAGSVNLIGTGTLSINDPGPTTVNITGTLTNLGGQINVSGPQAVLNAGSIVNGGMLSLPEGSNVNVANGFYQLDAGTLGEAIGANGFSILVAAAGQMVLAGTLDVMLDPGFNPAIGTTYKFLEFQPGELSGMFASIQNMYFNSGTEQWIVIYDNADGYVALEASPAPEPSSFMLLGTGLLSAAYGIRRWRR